MARVMDEDLIAALGLALINKDVLLVNSLHPSKAPWVDVRAHFKTVFQYLHGQAGIVTVEKDEDFAFDELYDEDDKSGTPMYTIDDIGYNLWVRAFDEGNEALMKVVQDHTSTALHKTGLEDHVMYCIGYQMEVGDEEDVENVLEKASWFANLDFLTQDCLNEFSDVMLKAIVNPVLRGHDTGESVAYMLNKHPKFDKVKIQQDLKTALLASTMNADELQDLKRGLEFHTHLKSMFSAALA
jgi:hypothetical protein